MELEKWDIYEWLEKAGMSQYAEGFVDNGYDTPDLCAELQNDDLTAIGVTNKKHRTVLFSKARELLNLLKNSETTDGPVVKQQAAPVSPIVVATSPTSPSNGQYSEPWQPWSGRGIGGGHATNGGTRVKMARTGSGEKPPLPPPNKHKRRQPPPSPLIPTSELPTFKREGGETGLTKLQLQLKIREELRAEGVVLSEPPYVNEEGQLCDEPLSELTERYSTKLKLQPLDIYDALSVIWNSENSFVTPLTPVQDPPHHHAVTLKGSSSENYDEPFDAADSVLTPDSVKHSPKEGSPKGLRSHTLPVNSSTGNYDEPFDSVSKFQTTTSSEESEKLRVDTQQVQSKTLPSPKVKAAAEEKEKKKVSAEREGSPKHSGFSKLFRRKDNKRSQSIKEHDLKPRDEKRSGKKGAKISFPTKAKDNTALSGKPQKKQNGASPRHSKHLESCSDTEESPRPTKKHGMKFRKVVTPPTPKRDEHMEFGSSSSSSGSTPEPVRNLRAIRSRGLTGSDLEISLHSLEDDDDDTPKKSWMVMSRSFDNLNDVKKESTIEKKKKNVFSRLFKFKTLQTPSRKKTKQKSKKQSNRGSLADEATPSQGEESALTNSISMPEIASVAPGKKKKKRVFASSSQTPPEQFSDNESSKLSTGSSPRHLGVPSAMIPVPTPPHVLPRTRSPSGDVIGQSPVGGSAPVKSTFVGGRAPTPDRAMTPSSAESKSQSPHSSGSDLAIHDRSGSSSPKSTGSGGGRKPPPPPKPRLLPSKFDERSLEIQRSSTMPWSKATSSSPGSSPKVAGRGRVPLKPTMPGSVPNVCESTSKPQQTTPDGGLNKSSEAVSRSPPKPRRNFVTRALSQPNLPESPLPGSATSTPQVTPTGNDNSSAIETPPTSDASTAVDNSHHPPEVPSNKTPPTPRQRPPPKPARSIKRKPVRDRVKQGGEDQTPSKGETVSTNETSLDKLPRNVTPPPVTPPPSSDVTSGPPKPSRRLKIPKVVDSSLTHEPNEERQDKTFVGEQPSVDGEMTTTAVNRTIDVSTPSPTSSYPSTSNEGADSFAKAAATIDHVSATTSELTKSIPGAGSPKIGKPRPMPKPRALQQLASKTVTPSSSSNTPSKPVPPSKPARAPVKVPTPNIS